MDTTISPEDRKWGMLAHLLTLLGYVIGFGHILPPLVIYLAKRNESEFQRDQAAESLNFQITLWIAVLVSLPFLCLIITIPLILLFWIALALAQLVLVIVAAMKASDGVRYRYPFCIRLVA